MTSPDERRPDTFADDAEQAEREAQRDAREDADDQPTGSDDPEEALLDGEPELRLAEESDEGRALAQDVRSDHYDDESHERR